MKPNSETRKTWIEQAACKGMDIGLFFATKDGGKAVRASARPHPEAVRACHECPVMEECAEWAIHHEAHGYQGGLTENQRAGIRRRRNIILWEPQSNLGPEMTKKYNRMAKLVVIEHGTSRGYKAEVRRGMEPCEECRMAHSAQTQIAKQRRKERDKEPQ